MYNVVGAKTYDKRTITEVLFNRRFNINMSLIHYIITLKTLNFVRPVFKKSLNCDCVSTAFDPLHLNDQ